MDCSGEAGWRHHVDREAGSERLGESSAAAGLVFRASCAPRETPGDVPVRDMPVIGADDHATQASGAHGNDVIGTPHSDRPAELGLRPGRACMDCPFRTPTWQSPISGKCPRGFDSTLLQTLPADELITVADDLESPNFGTVVIGKMHIRSDRRHGFEHRADAPGHDASFPGIPHAGCPCGAALQAAEEAVLDSCSTLVGWSRPTVRSRRSGSYGRHATESREFRQWSRRIRSTASRHSMPDSVPLRSTGALGASGTTSAGWSPGFRR